ncbi:MAG: hypothetical protein AAFX06_15340 [Planctomycetota bacterium]
MTTLHRISAHFVLLIAATLGGVPSSSGPSGEPMLLPAEAAVPKGYRLTANGWEDASKWGVVRDDPRLVEHWIQVQRNREPTWMRGLLSEIRSTSPLAIAVFQIAAITAILRVSRMCGNPHASKHCFGGGGDLRDE